jgi:SsrA-binding protein
MYFKGSLVKVQLGIGKGKKLYDKREDIAKKDAERRMRQQMK